MSVSAAKIDFDYTLEHKYTRERGPGLPDRRAGAGAPAADAAPARPCRRAQHRRLHLRLSRLAARAATTRRCGRRKSILDANQHPLPARRQRGPGGDRGLGHAAGPPVPGRQVRRRVRHLVRQGPGRRPLRRRVQARQLRPARRKHGGVLVLAGDDHGCQSSTTAHQSEHAFIAADDAGAQPGRRAGLSSTSACSAWRCRAIPGCWVGFKASPRRSRARPRSTSIRSASRSCMPDGFRAAAGRPQHPLARSAAGAGDAACTFKLYAALRLRARQPPRPHRARSAATRASASSPPASPISTCARRSTISASTTATPRAIGIRLYKVGMTWPLEPDGVRALRRGLEEILVVEEKRAADRGPAEGAALQLARRRPPARRRQVRRATANGSCASRPAS